MKKLVLLTFLSVLNVSVYGVCTDAVKIKSLWARSGGWVHVELEGVADSDIMNCGDNSPQGLMLNFTHANGSEKGKEMLFTMLLSAKILNTELQLCAIECDSQFPAYSSLYHINDF